ncbi:MAG TPA: SDR family NAD(P)-dependent oxidoreductase [Acidimicrobiales bacterium]|nr:SDR family NAD(P)-dependent oxidoreductase [Acidimicrobiales bacterium]
MSAVQPAGISGKVVLVTGAQRNIGRATAVAFARAGASLALTSRRGAEALEETSAAVREAGGDADGFALDLADPEGPERLGAELLARYGRVDVVVHNAAIRPQTPVGGTAAATWDEVFAVNVRGAFLLSQALLPAMVEAGWGRLVFIGGISSYIGQRERVAVLSSKLAVVGLARALAFEFAAAGVTANVVVPGFIDTVRGEVALYGPALDVGGRTRNVPMGRLGGTAEVANACLFLASELAAFTTGQELFVSGGAHPITREGVGG